MQHILFVSSSVQKQARLPGYHLLYALLMSCFTAKQRRNLSSLLLVSLARSDLRKEWFELCIEEHESEHAYESPATEERKRKEQRDTESPWLQPSSYSTVALHLICSSSPVSVLAKVMLFIR